jgi:Secretion system C-terminal sorting domain/Ig-like domain CHU_C associated
MCFVVVDAQTSPANTTVTFTSSNTSLLPLSSMAISGADTNKVLSFTPIPYQSGTSLITITATDSNGASTTQSFSIIVAPGAPISIIALNNIIACSGDSVLLQCAIPQGTTINWYVNAIASGIGSAQYATTQSASIYAVCTNAQGCATKSNTINATVKPTPQVQCTINGPTTICVGDSVQLQALSTAGYSYQWFKNTQLLPNANSAIYYAKQSGNYSYVATLNGCSKTSNAQSVQVLPVPIASITTPSTTVICNGQGALLQASTGTGYTYQWTMNGFDIAGATNPTYTATIGSYYTVKVSNGYCARTSSPITITVNTAPVAIIHWNGTQLFSPISFYSYQWYLNGVLIPGATGQYYTPTQTGVYYVMVGNENGCKSLSPNYNLLTLFVNSLSTPSLPIYPNPTNGMLQVDNFKEGTLYVYNAMGQLIIQQTEPIIDLSKQANGIYHIRAYNQAQELIGIGRVVKE